MSRPGPGGNFDSLIDKIRQILNDPQLANFLRRHKVVASILTFLMTVSLAANFLIGINQYFPLVKLPTPSATTLPAATPPIYEETRISDLSTSCKNYFVYQGQKEKQDLEAKMSIQPKRILEAKLEPMSNAANIWPVFRWKCRYYSAPRSGSPSASERKPPEKQLLLEIGLDLDSYCKAYYKNSGADKASYHDYEDASSWYCTDVHPGEA
jgi:hypothetical protein